MFGVSYIVIEIEKPQVQNGKSKCKGEVGERTSFNLDRDILDTCLG